MDMMIVARPESPIIIIITKETPEYDAKTVNSTSVFQPKMIEVIQKYLEQYKINTISTYGPKDYIQYISHNIEQNFDYNVTQIAVGEE